jgi:hypothetical protein
MSLAVAPSNAILAGLAILSIGIFCMSASLLIFTWRQDVATKRRARWKFESVTHTVSSPFERDSELGLVPGLSDLVYRLRQLASQVEETQRYLRRPTRAETQWREERERREERDWREERERREERDWRVREEKNSRVKQATEQLHIEQERIREMRLADRVAPDDFSIDEFAFLTSEEESAIAAMIAYFGAVEQLEHDVARATHELES